MSNCWGEDEYHDSLGNNCSSVPPTLWLLSPYTRDVTKTTSKKNQCQSDPVWGMVRSNLRDALWKMHPCLALIPLTHRGGHVKIIPTWSTGFLHLSA